MSCPYTSQAALPAKEPETSKKDVYKPIPQPPIHWFTRNISEINPEFPISSIWRLADTYGEIYQLDFITHKSVIISSYDLINEICDEERFDKVVSGGLKEARALVGDGLFSAYPDEAVRETSSSTLYLG